MMPRPQGPDDHRMMPGPARRAGPGRRPYRLSGDGTAATASLSLRRGREKGHSVRAAGQGLGLGRGPGRDDERKRPAMRARGGTGPRSLAETRIESGRPGERTPGPPGPSVPVGGPAGVTVAAVMPCQ